MAVLRVPPTGKTIAVQALNFYRLSGGQFIEERGQPILLGLLIQIAQCRHPEPSLEKGASWTTPIRAQAK